jgi:dihydrofolate reductase
VTLTQYYTATSLDGYIADEAHSLDWLDATDSDHAGPLNYTDFFAGVGALAMGAATYEWLRAHVTEWPYVLPCWVFTHRELEAWPAAAITFVSGDVRPVHAALVEAAGGKNVWIAGGGNLAGQFAEAGLLDEVIVYIAPFALGGGALLLPRRLELRLEETARNGDFVTARYSVGRAARPPSQ